MPYAVLGLPLHALVLHATVVLLPLTALLLVLAAFSARVRARAGVVLPLLGVVCLVLVPVTTSSGGQLAQRLPPGPQIAAHARAADAVLPWTAALAVACVAVWVLEVRRRRPLLARSAASVLLAVAATTAAVGVTVQVAHVGHLGAQAAWSFAGDLPPRAG